MFLEKSVLCGYLREFQFRQIPLNDVVKLKTTGDGLGIAQLHVEYNTPATDKEQCAFEFSVVAEAIIADKSAIEIRTCAR